VEYQLTKLADCEHEVHIVVTYDEAAPEIEQAYERARQELTIEGFRKGKAPLELIKQRYGAKIEADALESLGHRLVRELARRERWMLLSDPQLVNVERAPDSIRFSFRYYTLPDLTVDLSGIKLQKPLIEVSEDEVEAQLEQLRLRYSTVQEDADHVSDYYHEVKLHFQPVDPESGMPLLDREAEELTLPLYESDVLQELRQQLLNARVGDSFLYTLSGAELSQPDQPPQTYRVTVQSIRRLQPAELTPEFVQQLSGGRLADVDALRNYIRQELQRQHDSYAQSLLRNQLELELARRYPFTPPKPIVHSIARDLVQALQRGELRVPAEYLREGETGIYRFLAELADLQARLSILELLLLQQYQVQLTPEDIHSLARSLGMSEAELERQLREDPDLDYDVRRRKLWQLLLQQVEVEPIPYSDYVQRPHS